MEATGKVIRLKPGYTSIDGLMMENAEEGLFTRRDLQIAVAKARNVLNGPPLPLQIRRGNGEQGREENNGREDSYNKTRKQ